MRGFAQESAAVVQKRHFLCRNLPDSRTFERVRRQLYTCRLFYDSMRDRDTEIYRRIPATEEATLRTVEDIFRQD